MNESTLQSNYSVESIINRMHLKILISSVECFNLEHMALVRLVDSSQIAPLKAAISVILPPSCTSRPSSCAVLIQTIAPHYSQVSS